ncbi:hypothetical protein [Winogradskyella sp. R77965]|uniref:hypothetical protein n=1 Tax=Winogradskyella sp. R77965 TaxID=3093872 RepID=UPI0037DD218E
MSKKAFIIYVVSFVCLFIVIDRVANKFLVEGLNRYYGIGELNQVALVGHSHLMLGIDKIQIEETLKTKVTKYTREGVNVSDRLVMIKQLIDKNPNLKTIIYGVDAWTFTGEGLSKNSYKLFYPFLDDSSIDNYVHANGDPLDYISKKWVKSSRYNEQLVSSAMRGYLEKWDNLKYGIVDTLKLNKTIEKGTFRKINNNFKNIEVFKETLKLLMENDINVILMYVPTIDKLETVQQVDFDLTIKIFEDLTNDTVKFLNLQEPWSKRYDLFYDPIHLNPEGQRQITKELVKFLKSNK